MSDTMTLIAEARAATLDERFEDAAALGRRVLGAMPSCLLALRIVAQAELELDRDGALAAFEDCAAIDPEDALAYVGQAIWYQRHEDVDSSAQRWVRAWELDPYNQSIRRALVNLTGELPESALADAIGLLREHRFEEAAEILRTLQQDVARLALLTAFSRLGQQRQAFDLAPTVHAAFPRSVKAMLYVAADEDRAGRTLRSRELIARVEQIDPGLSLFADVVRDLGLQNALDLHRASRAPALAR